MQLFTQFISFQIQKMIFLFYLLLVLCAYLKNGPISAGTNSLLSYMLPTKWLIASLRDALTLECDRTSSILIADRRSIAKGVCTLTRRAHLWMILKSSYQSKDTSGHRQGLLNRAVHRHPHLWR